MLLSGVHEKMFGQILFRVFTQRAAAVEACGADQEA